MSQNKNGSGMMSRGEDDAFERSQHSHVDLAVQSSREENADSSSRLPSRSGVDLVPKSGDMKQGEKYREHSPPKKRFRSSDNAPAEISAPLPPFVKKPPAALTESSIESPADPLLDEDHAEQATLDVPETPLPASARERDDIDLLNSPTTFAARTSPYSDSSPLPPPPAPPSTPASVPPNFSEIATPRPGGLMANAHILERQAEAATPAPTRQKRATGPTLEEDFSEWAVGERYELLRILGRGSYGEVAQARDLLQSKTGDVFVAIKRITSAFDQEVDAVRLYREIHILRRLRGHECIIQLLDVVQPPSDDLDDFHDLYLVFEYVDTDLYKLIMSPQYLTTEHIRTFLYQLLTGLKYIHSSSVIHRDLKPANILLNEDCSLKICDFGLARIVNPSSVVSSATGDVEPKEVVEASGVIDTPISFGSPPKGRLTRQLTKHVVTRWYRAPELILIQPYTSAVDIWSLGCILAELLSMQEGSVPGYQDRVPLFPGGSCYPLSGEGSSVKKDERLDQLAVIFGVIGTPEPKDIDWSGKAHEYIKSLEKQKGTPFESLFPAADPCALDLLQKMLKFNPRQRFTAEEALEHDFLKGVRRKEMERAADEALVGPDFLESAKVDIDILKKRTYEEVVWYKDQN